jgi:uncharacterized protein YggT (Ycf19 family)
VSVLPLLTLRVDVASFLSALIWVYTLVIIAYIVSTLVLSMGLRIPYSRSTDAVLGFLRDLSEPYLRIFRRFIPAFGAFDFSPIIAIFALRIVGGVVVSLIRG